MEKFTLRVIRAMNELNQEQMAKRLGITRQYYSKMESRKIPISAKVYLALYREFGYEISQIQD